MSDWTPERILALAPDSGSAKSGRELANPRKWVSLGKSEAALWGECQGSGKDPYRTQIDLSEPAFKCSCPSRKFPCKHGLGLFLLHAEQAASFGTAPPPAWVAEWLEGRSKRAETKAAKAAEPPKPVDEAAQAKRQEAREKKVKAGVEALELWLQDLVRGGLAQAQTQPPSFWEAQAARLVDAQAPGLARLVRELGGVPGSGEGWPERMLRRMGLIHLLLRGYARQEALGEGTRADVRAGVGWPVEQAEVLARPGAAGLWNVLGQRVEQEDRLRARRTWLLGEAGQPALVLEFAHGTAPFDAGLVAGTRFRGELAFFPGAFPLRALVKERGGKVEMLDEPPAHPTLADAVSACGGAVACQPWLERFPLCLANVVPTQTETGWALRDGAGHVLPVARQSAQTWTLCALSGGHPITVFGEWDGESLYPLTAWAGGSLYILEAA